MRIGEHVPPAVFPELGEPLGKLPEQWPKEPAEVPAGKLSLATHGAASWPLLRNPYTPAGWQRPACPTVRNTDPARGIEPLVEFAASDGLAVVGVVCRGGTRDGGPAMGAGAVLPTLAVHPYLFDNPNASESVADLRLDAVGRAVLLETLQRIEKE